MKKLTFVRHGKSDWSIDGQPDIDRPLNARGYVDSHKMAKEILEKYGAPSAIISSSAIRAISTALIFAGELGYPKSTIRIEPELYDSGAEEYLNVVRELDDKHDSAILFGHNPSISDIYTLLTDHFLDIPTCAVLVMESSATHWSEVGNENTKLIEVRTPKQLVM